MVDKEHKTSLFKPSAQAGEFSAQLPSARQGLNLEPRIQVEQERTAHQRVVVHGIRFNLDKNSLQSIQVAQQTGRRLEISRQLLTNLRYYAISGGNNSVQPGLTFSTYYQRGNSEEALVRSFISTDGDILHQVKSECLERPSFCLTLVSAHYWLVNQLLSQLRFQVMLGLNLLAWGLSLLSVASTVIPQIGSFVRNPWLLLGPVVMSWLLQVGLHRFLRWLFPVVTRYTLRWLLRGLLSRRLLTRRIAKGVLAWLVP